MPEILTDAYLLFTFVFKQALIYQKSLPNLGRLKTEEAPSQVPYPVSVGFQFLFLKLGYRFV